MANQVDVGSNPSRRDFMRTSAAATMGMALGGYALGARAQESEVLRVGLIGCGGRGTGAARQAVLADPNTRLVALGDAFSDRVAESYDKLKNSDIGERVVVDEDHKFSGFDNYKGVIDSCDVICMASPPHFRPKHLRYAIEQGKHVFCEKPIAVDPAGVRHVKESCRMAQEKGLSVVSGLCYRYEFAKQATIQRIHDGLIGDIVAMQTTYNTGGLWHKGREPEWSDMEYQIRNWLYFCWLSGDHINEQHIHSLDKIAWAMGDAYPVKATASGGRIQRTDPKYGNIYDHFNTVYEWDNGIKAFSSCRQWESTSTDVSDHIFGTKGTAHLQQHLIEPREGEAWKYQADGPDDMYQNEHNALFAAIRKGEPINNGDYMCKSTLMAVMGRISAYTGKSVTWDEVLNMELDLSPPAYEWGELAVAPVPVPGARA